MDSYLYWELSLVSALWIRNVFFESESTFSGYRLFRTQIRILFRTGSINCEFYQLIRVVLFQKFISDSELPRSKMIFFLIRIRPKFWIRPYCITIWYRYGTAWYRIPVAPNISVLWICNVLVLIRIRLCILMLIQTVLWTVLWNRNRNRRNRNFLTSGTGTVTGTVTC